MELESKACRLQRGLPPYLHLLIVGLLTIPVGTLAVSPVFVDPIDATCQGQGTAGLDCFPTIQQGVDAATAPASVFVRGGFNYAESVDLSGMATPGDIVLESVPVGAVIDAPPGDRAIDNSISPFPGSVTIRGFTVHAPAQPDIEPIFGTCIDNTFVDCVVDANCGAGEKCLKGRCRVITAQSCRITSDCVGGGDILCALPGFCDETAPACASDIDCTAIGYERCSFDGICQGRRTCTISADCPSGPCRRPGRDCINLNDVDGDVTIDQVTASNCFFDGVDVDARGKVNIFGSTSESNGNDGYQIHAGDDVHVDGSDAIANLGSLRLDPDGDDGLRILGGRPCGAPDQPCVPIGPAPPCITSDDCPFSPSNCINMVCRCDSNAGCPDGAVCRDGDCVDPFFSRGDVRIEQSNATGNGEGIQVEGANNTLTILDTVASDSVDGDGIEAESGEGQDHQTIVIERVVANSNGNDGIRLSAKSVTLDSVTANDNSTDSSDEDGFDVEADRIVGTNIRADGNRGDGMDLRAIELVQLNGCQADDNGHPVNNPASSGVQILSRDPEEFLDVVVTDCAARNNAQDGINIQATRDVEVRRCNATGNGQDGVDIRREFEDVCFPCVEVEVARARNVLVEDCIADENGEDGIDTEAGGTTEILRVCTRQNEQDGIDVKLAAGDATVLDSSSLGNVGAGICMNELGAGAYQSGSNNIAGNTGSGFTLRTALTVNAEQNWWGAPSGPFHAVNNAAGTGNQVIDANNGGGSGTVDFQPFLVAEADNGDPCVPTATPTPTLTATATPTATSTSTPAVPVPDQTPEAGDTEICGSASPNLDDDCIEVCVADGCLGTSGTDENGRFCVELDRPLETGDQVEIRDNCSGITSPVVPAFGPAPAPALSAIALATLLLMLIALGAVGIRLRNEWR